MGEWKDFFLLHCLEFVGSDGVPLFHLGSYLEKNINIGSAQKERLEGVQWMLSMQRRRRKDLSHSPSFQKQSYCGS